MDLRVLFPCVFVLVLSLLALDSAGASHVWCGPGELYVPATNDNPTGRCEPCSPGHFQDESNHRHKGCKKCSAFHLLNNPRLVLVEECTIFHQMIVGCVPGFYLIKDDCHTCTNCQLLGKFEKRACGKDRDTVCCDHDDMIVDQEGECHHTLPAGASPVLCGPGELFVPATKDNPTGRCEPCSPGHFQDESHHRRTGCKKCSVFDDLKNPRLVLVDECTRFHHIVVECIPGFYLIKDDCHTCTDCKLLGKFEKRACGKHRDTMCCDHDDMVVVSREGECEFAPVFCGAGEYHVITEAGQRDECRPCEPGTTNTETRHQRFQCEAIPHTAHSGYGWYGDGYQIVMGLVLTFVAIYIVRKVIPRFISD